MNVYFYNFMRVFCVYLKALFLILEPSETQIIGCPSPLIPRPGTVTDDRLHFLHDLLDLERLEDQLALTIIPWTLDGSGLTLLG